MDILIYIPLTLLLVILTRGQQMNISSGITSGPSSLRNDFSLSTVSYTNTNIMSGSPQKNDYSSRPNVTKQKSHNDVAEKIIEIQRNSVFKLNSSYFGGKKETDDTQNVTLIKEMSNIVTFDEISAQLRRERRSNNFHSKLLRFPKRLSPSRKIMNKYRRNVYFSKNYAPQFTFTAIEQTVSPGTQVSLKCSAVGAPLPTITWTRDNKPLIHSIRTHIGSFQSPSGEIISHVNISNVTPRQGGLFKCVAENVIGSIFHFARLNVYGESFIRQMSNLTIPVGSTANIFCPVGGYPMPHITWKHEGKLILTNFRYNILPNTTLLIKAIRRSDQGYYSCLVEGLNHLETTSRMFLRVLKPPAIAHFTSLKDLRENDKAQLTCVISSGDQPMTIEILKDGGRIQFSEEVEHKTISDFSSALLFHNLSENHSGNYTCVAENPAASTNVSSIIQVKISPRWIGKPVRRINIPEGMFLDIGCKAAGFPLPKIEWSRYQQISKKSQTIDMDEFRISKASNGSLLISTVRKSDEGGYLCKASNGIGNEISNVVQVVVNVGPKILSEGRKLRANVGQSVYLKCIAKGDPPIIIHWKKDNNPITESHKYTLNEAEDSVDVRDNLSITKSVMQLHNINSLDKGFFTCTTTNQYGSESEVYELTVLEPPASPIDVKVTEIKSRSAKVTWKVNVPAAVTIQYKESAFSSWLEKGKNISIGDWSTAHIISALTPFTSYRVRLFAFNELGVSLPSEVQKFKTSEEAPDKPPFNVIVTSKTSKSLNVKWNTSENRQKKTNIRGYLISYRRQNFEDVPQSITVPKSKGYKTIEEYTIRQLESDSLYELSIQAFNQIGFSPPSSPRIVVATQNEVPDCSPTRSSCKTTNSIGLRILWEPPSSNCYNGHITGYTISAIFARYGSTEAQSLMLNTTNLEKSITSLPSSTNVSVCLMAYNNVGIGKPSNPIYCMTPDEVRSPPGGIKTYVIDESTLSITWTLPVDSSQSISHCTVYYIEENQPTVKRKLLDVNEKQPLLVTLRNLQKGVIIQSWVTCSTADRESPPTERKVSHLIHSKNQLPLAVGGRSKFKLRNRQSFTLICRRIGDEPTSLSWMVDGTAINNNQNNHILSSGDIHISGIEGKSEYICVVKNRFGKDSIKYSIVMVRSPISPNISLVSSTYDTIQFKIESKDDGGSPVIDFKIIYKQNLVEWEEMNVRPLRHDTPSLFTIPNLRCGSFLHVYGIAINSEGSSNPGKVIRTKTTGNKPMLPRSSDIIELNSTCVTLLLYAWPENDCLIKYWKIEYKEESEAWTSPRRTVFRNETDIGICDLETSSVYIFRLTAVSDAGITSAQYKISIQYHLSKFSDQVQELYSHQQVGSFKYWNRIPLSLMLSCVAILICSILVCTCVLLRHRTLKKTRQNNQNPDTKIFSRRKSSLLDVNTKNEFSSMMSLKEARIPSETMETGDSYEILPYASTYRVRDQTLTYEPTFNNEGPPSQTVYEDNSQYTEKRIRRKRKTKISNERENELNPKRFVPQHPLCKNHFMPPPYQKEMSHMDRGEWLTESDAYGHVPLQCKQRSNINKQQNG